jgi:hypothetical protein
MWEYFENIYSNEVENLEEMDKFLNAFDLFKLNQEGINHLNRSIRSNEIEEIIKSLPTKKSPEPNGFAPQFYKTFKEQYASSFSMN